MLQFGPSHFVAGRVLSLPLAMRTALNRGPRRDPLDPPPAPLCPVPIANKARCCSWGALRSSDNGGWKPPPVGRPTQFIGGSLLDRFEHPKPDFVAYYGFERYICDRSVGNDQLEYILMYTTYRICQGPQNC
jgi:hypothetical protein